MHFQWISTQDEAYIAMVALRYEVLRKPLNLTFPEAIAQLEQNDFLLIGTNSQGVLVSCLVFTAISKQVLKMRQVAVHPSLQGKGIGQKMVKYAEKWAQEQFYKKIELHARLNVVPFYQRLHYKQVGEPFEEVTIPHLKMEKEIL